MLRRFHLLLLLATLVLGFIGVSRLSYNVDILDLLPKNLSGAEGTRLLRDTFEKANQIILTIEAPTAAAAQMAVDSLEAEFLRHPELVKRVMARPTWESDGRQILSLAAYAWLNARPEDFAALEKKLAGDNLRSELEEKLGALATEMNGMALTQAAYDPLGLLDAAKSGLGVGFFDSGSSEFGSRDGKFRIMLVDAATPPASYRETDAWIRSIKTDIVEPWQKHSLPLWPLKKKLIESWSGKPVGSWLPALPSTAAELLLSKPDRVAEDLKNIQIAYTGSPAFRAEIASGMEDDLSQSIGGITLVVGFLFWLLHRTIRPLFLLLASMLVSGLITLGIAGLAYGSLNVMSMGFAAILMGMIEDFGVVGLHEWLENPRDSFAQIHRRVFPGIFWSATTSAAVFGSLSLSVLPGIAQLGILTAIGILVGAAVMLYGFLPLAMKWSGRSHDKPRDLSRASRSPRWPGLAAGTLLAASMIILTMRGLPKAVHEPRVLHPKNCAAMDATLRMQERMQPPDLEGEWLPVFLHRKTEAELNAALAAAENHLAAAKAAGTVNSYFLPGGIFPNASHQQANHSRLAGLTALEPRVLHEMDGAGFAADGLILTKSIFEIWKTWAAEPAEVVRWPSEALLAGSLGRLLHRNPGGVSASGFVKMPPGVLPGGSPAVTELERIPGVFPGGWRYLDERMRPLVSQEIRRVCLPAVVVLLALLVCVFRNLRDCCLALGSLIFSGLLLLAAMQLLGISWNFVNIGAVPLTLGLGLDFNIHMIFALRRISGDAQAHAHGIGRALAYCGLSTSLGFGSLAMAGNNGLVTFGQCAMIGVAATLFTAAFVVPWAHFRLNKPAVAAG